MKKLFYSLFMMALTAMTFTSCEDVPMPYDDPNKGGGGSTEPDIEIIGDGSAENPYNASSAVALFKSLASGAKSEMVYIKGKVSSIKEQYGTQYGNGTFYISDDGSSQNQFYVFRALYLGNKKYTSGDLLKEGDEVIICGVVTNYNGTIETEQNNAFLYSLNGVSEGGGNVGPAGEAKGKGTLEDPYNPAGVLAYIKTLGSDVESDHDVYIKGKVSSITEQYGTQYGNATFNIVEEGAEGTAFMVFRALYLGNKKYTSGDLLKEGDEVIVCGRVVNYKGNTPETAQGKAYLYSLNGKSDGGGGGTPTGEAKGSGTQADPYNPAGASAAVANLTWTSNDDYQATDEVYVKGKISRIADKGTFTEGGSYGNASFYISEDGTQNGEFYCYRILYLGNKKYESGQTDIKVGDEVIIYGKLMNYRGNTPETVSGKAYLYSLNGKTEGGGEEKPQSAGSYESPLTVTEAIAKAEAEVAWVKGYIVGYVTGQVLSSGARFTSTAPEGETVSNTNLLIAASASETDVNKCMPIQLSRDYRADFALDANPGILGKEVIMTGQLTKYFGVPGIKNPTYIEANGKSVGNKVKYRKR